MLIGLPTTKLGTHLEQRVNNYLSKTKSGAGDVTIRVLSISDKTCEVKPGMKAKCALFLHFLVAHWIFKTFKHELFIACQRYYVWITRIVENIIYDCRYTENMELPESFQYRAKAIFAWEEIDGHDIMFYGMHVQEYGSDCPQPNQRCVDSKLYEGTIWMFIKLKLLIDIINTNYWICYRRVYIAYLDSVHFFQPRQCRTSVYHEILIGYLEWVKRLGYVLLKLYKS